MNLMKTFKRESRKFVLSVGDEGAILTLVDGNRMVKRLFTTTPNAPDFRETISSTPEVPIYVLVDVVDQAYVQHTLPPVSAFNIRKLIQRKLAKDFDENDIKATMCLSKGTPGQKELHYLFVSIRHVPPFTEWMNVISELPNKFAGVYPFPIEAMRYLQDIKSGLAEVQKEQAEWEIIVTHNKIGGFRQIVLRGGKTIFTRIAQPIGGQTPDVVAGNIEQETLNTIEYIRRLGFVDEQGLAIYVIASPDVKKVLELAPLPCNLLRILTPYEASAVLKISGAAEERDRFGDVVAAVHFAGVKKHLLRLSTPYLTEVSRLADAIIGLRAGAILLSAVILFLSISSVVDYSDLRRKVELAKIDKAASEEKLSQIENRQLPFDRQPQQVRNVSALDAQLTDGVLAPFEFIGTYGDISGFDTFVSSLDISIDQQKGAAAGQKKNSPQEITSRFTVQFSNVSHDSLDQLLENINAFTAEVIKKFENYQVSFSGLPEERDIKLNLGQGVLGESETFSFDLNIKGPNLPVTAGNKKG